MRGLAASFLARRMTSSRLLLGSVLLTVLITSTLTAALATFAGEGLPQAVRHQLAHSAAVSIAISGSGTAATAAADTRAIHASMRRTFGSVPYRLDTALWSNPLGLPAARGSRTVPLTQAASIGQIESSAVLVAGTWPGPPPAGGPAGAAFPAAAAQRLGLAPGDLLSVRDRVSGQRLRVRITGLFGFRHPASPYWHIDLIGTSGVSVQQQFTTYGPLVVSPAAFGGRGLAVGGATWVVLPDGARIGAAGISPLAARVGRAQEYLRNSTRLGGLQVTTGLPALLAGLGRKLVVARSLLSMGLIELLLLAAAALVLAARLLASHREEETAIMSARGAARWQMVRPAAAEAAVLGVVAAGAGALLGSRLAGALMNTGALHGAGLRVSGVPSVAWLAALAVLVLSMLILLWPMLRPVAPGVSRVRRGRQAALAGIAHAGGDLALLALAGVAAWELRTYSAVAHPVSGGIGIDPVPVLAPALALAGITLIPLRLLPALARAIDGLIRRTRRLGAALASWEISRRPVRQSGPVLLVILAVGAGSVALAQYQSWRRSARDQASFTVGADVRVDTLAPLPLAGSAAVARAPGVTAAMSVVSTPLASGGEVLALDPRRAASVALLRPDLAPVPAHRLWREITPARRAPGLVLPGRPARLLITASLSGGGGGGLGDASATVTIQDASGAVYLVPAGGLPSGGRPHSLVAVLSRRGRAEYPLRLLGVSLAYTVPPYQGAALLGREASHPAVLTIGHLATAPVGKPFGAPFAAGGALAAWRPSASSPELLDLFMPGGTIAPDAIGTSPTVKSWRPAAAGGRALDFQPGEDASAKVLFISGLVPAAVIGNLAVTAPAPVTDLPAIATQSYLRATHAAPGALVPVTVDGANVPVRIVGTVSHFPTVTGGALIVDQAVLQGLLASRGVAPLPVTEWWLHTAGGAVPPGLPRGAAVTDRARLVAARLADPLSAVPQQAALAIAAAAALLAAVGFAVSVAASLRERRTQSAVLAALGVARHGQAGQLCLEQLMLSLPAAAAGLLAGAGLAHVLVPAVTLTANATRPVPPALVEFPWGWAVWLALAVATIPVLVAAVTVARRPDPAAELRAAQAL